jgi:hypothetical protein
MRRATEAAAATECAPRAKKRAFDEAMSARNGALATPIRRMAAP